MGTAAEVAADILESGGDPRDRSRQAGVAIAAALPGWHFPKADARKIRRRIEDWIRKDQSALIAASDALWHLGRR